MDIGNLDNVFGNKPTSNINNGNNATSRTAGQDGKNTLGQGVSLDDMMAQVGDYDDKNALPAGQVNQGDDDDSDDDKPEEKEAPISKPDGHTAAAAEAALEAAVKKPTTTAAPITPSSA